VSARKTIVFDGVCVLCSAWVGFVIKRDLQQEFQFAAVQTATGRELLLRHGIDPDNPVTFLLVEDGVAYGNSDAVLRIVSRFGVAWRLLARIVSVIPRPLRDALYGVIARNRYRIFGRREVCFAPSAREMGRFLH